MCSLVKFLFVSLLIAGVAVAQEPQESTTSNDSNIGTHAPPLESFFHSISEQYDRIRQIIGNRYFNSTSHSPLRDWLARIRQQRNASLEIENFFKRLSETWTRILSSANSTIPPQSIQLLKDLIQIRNESNTAMRNRIEAFFKSIFENLNQRLSESNVTICTRNLLEIRELIRQRIAQHWNTTQSGLERLLQRIDYIIKQRLSALGRTTPRSTDISGGGSASISGSFEHGHHHGSTITIGNPETSGEGSSGSGASGSAESGSGGVSSGSGESGGSA